MKSAGIVILAILAVITMIFGGWAFKYFTAPIQGRVDAEQRIESGTNRIQQYNKFFDLCASAQTTQTSLQTQKEMLELVDGKEAERIRSNVAGMTAQLARTVNQYNVDARKDYTAARFHDSDLPFQLNASRPINCQ